MFDESVLACLQRIEDRLNSDEYEPCTLVTLGGGGSTTYVARSPYNTEAEWSIYAISVGGTGSASILISASNPAISSLDVSGTTKYGSTAGGQESNYVEGVGIIVTNTGAPTFSDQWQPLGRGANVYMTFNLTGATSCFVVLAFRRKLDKAIPTPPRRQATTHTHVQSRRGARTFAQGFEAQYPGTDYEHEVLPETEDLPAVGNVEEMPTPAQRVLAKLRNGGR